jgi:hypothetical protein
MPSAAISAAPRLATALSMRRSAAARSDHAEGTSSVAWIGPRSALSLIAASTSGESTVRFATTRRCVVKAMRAPSCGS